METKSGFPLIAGVDIGGTNVRCAVARAEEPTRFLAWRTAETPVADGPEAIADFIAAEVAACAREIGAGSGELGALGVATAGVIDAPAGRVVLASNLGWRDVPLARLLADRTGLETAIENDVKAAALAEYHHGAGLERSPLVYLTISTGVAAGIVVDGRVLRGRHHAAGELGRFVPDRSHLGADWEPNGCLELTSAGVGLARAWAERRNGHEKAVTAADVFAAARAGDADAEMLVARAADYLALSAVAIGTVLDPAVLVLGGSIAQHEPRFAERIREVAAEALLFPPEVTLASLGADAPLIGALTLAVAPTRTLFQADHE